jgi:hypothetical protein
MPAHRMGRLWKFKKDEVDEWVKAGGAARSSDKRNQTMTIKTPDLAKSKKKRDPDLVNAEIALKRAAQKAREFARNTSVSDV